MPIKMERNKIEAFFHVFVFGRYFYKKKKKKKCVETY